MRLQPLHTYIFILKILMENVLLIKNKYRLYTCSARLLSWEVKHQRTYLSETTLHALLFEIYRGSVRALPLSSPYTYNCFLTFRKTPPN